MVTTFDIIALHREEKESMSSHLQILIYKERITGDPPYEVVKDLAQKIPRPQ